MAEHNELGKQAEDKAVEFLQKKGYTVIARNFRWQKAEIDIIAEHLGMIIIVEVKARTNAIFIEPQEAVNKRKMRLLISAADEFLQANNRTEEVRFDIVSVVPQQQGAMKIIHIENAFEPYDAN